MVAIFSTWPVAPDSGKKKKKEKDNQSEKIFEKIFYFEKKKRVLILHDTAGCARVVFAGLGSVKRICAQKVVVLAHWGGGLPQVYSSLI